MLNVHTPSLFCDEIILNSKSNKNVPVYLSLAILFQKFLLFELKIGKY